MENIRFGDFNDGRVGTLPSHLHAWPEKSEARNRWSLVATWNSYFRSVLPGRASAIQAIHGMALAGLKAHHASSKQLWRGSQHSRRACSSRHVPGSTGKKDSNDGAGCWSCFTFLSTWSKDCGANAAFSNVRRVTEPTPFQNGNGNPRRVSHCWQVTKETLLPRKTRWTKAKKCTIASGSQLIEKGLSDGHRVNRLVLGNEEVHSGYLRRHIARHHLLWLVGSLRCPIAWHHFLWLVRSLEHISAFDRKVGRRFWQNRA